jgi:F-type H+-transporting ATPase subunit gamma
VSNRRGLEQRRRVLGDIREIMSSMKTLAYMETRKLDRTMGAQRAVVGQIETIAEEFLGCYPETLPPVDGLTPVCVLLGSERGFCGDFNHQLLAGWRSSRAAARLQESPVIATGRKLHVLLEGAPEVVARIDGSNLAEEAETTLGKIIQTLEELRRPGRPLSLAVFHHDPERKRVCMSDVLPPFQRYRGPRPGCLRLPLLHLPPGRFLAELVDHYLFARLHEIIHASLMAENLRRVEHLEAAVRHLDKKAADLRRRCNALQQEEIIEEIEVILLSQVGPAPGEWKGSGGPVR